jgi:adenylate cyclase
MHQGQESVSSSLLRSRESTAQPNFRGRGFSKLSEATPKRVKRRLAAILAADLTGYSRLMSQDEIGTLRALTAHRKIMDRLIAEHGGRIANTAGDRVLAEFPSAVDAVQCATEMQKAMAD